MDHVEVVAGFLKQEPSRALAVGAVVVEVGEPAKTNEMANPHGLHLSDLARIDNVLERDEVVHISHVHADHESRARLSPGLEHAVAIFGVDGHGLLAEHVLAGFKRGDRVLRVQVVAREYAHSVDIVPGHEVAVVVAREGVFVLLLEAAEELVVDIASGHDLRAWVIVPVAGHPSSMFDSDESYTEGDIWHSEVPAKDDWGK